MICVLEDPKEVVERFDTYVSVLDSYTEKDLLDMVKMYREKLHTCIIYDIFYEQYIDAVCRISKIDTYLFEPAFRDLCLFDRLLRFTCMYNNYEEYKNCIFEGWYIYDDDNWFKDTVKFRNSSKTVHFLSFYKNYDYGVESVYNEHDDESVVETSGNMESTVSHLSLFIKKLDPLFFDHLPIYLRGENNW